MRVTRQEIEEATGCADARELIELNLASKFVHDLGYIGKLTKLQDLNLAFNDLRSLGGGELAACAGSMRVLNVMHNKLRDLAGVQGLSELQCLRASKNRIEDLSAYATCGPIPSPLA
jgi:Leucine-rich repeat (LRR) protein